MSGDNGPVILLANATGGCGVAAILPQGGAEGLRNHGAWPIHGDRTLVESPICGLAVGDVWLPGRPDGTSGAGGVRGARREPPAAGRRGPGLPVPGRQPLQVTAPALLPSWCWPPGDRQRPGPGMPGPGSGRLRRARPGVALLVICGGAAGLIAAAWTTMPRRAAPALSLAMAIETISGFEGQGTAVCLRVPVRVTGTVLPSASSVTPDGQVQHQRGHG